MQPRQETIPIGDDIGQRWVPIPIPVGLFEFGISFDFHAAPRAADEIDVGCEVSDKGPERANQIEILAEIVEEVLSQAIIRLEADSSRGFKLSSFL
ncbi:MAG: hypothetical protein WBF03_11470 [Xanthobacteraceae bacterium]